MSTFRYEIAVKMVGKTSVTLFSVFDRVYIARRVLHGTDEYGSEHFEGMFVCF